MDKCPEAECFALYDFFLGTYKIAYTSNAITCIKRVIFVDKEGEKIAKCNSVSSDLSELAKLQLQEYFEGERKIFDLPLDMRGTDFQKQVWAALCDIPYGETCSYKALACAIGNPKASRAVGMANNKNPVSIVVPCHRVIGADGKLVGYAGGLDIKSALLQLEKN